LNFPHTIKLVTDQGKPKWYIFNNGKNVMSGQVVDSFSSLSQLEDNVLQYKEVLNKSIK
jgi:hypothetical protein